MAIRREDGKQWRRRDFLRASSAAALLAGFTGRNSRAIAIGENGSLEGSKVFPFPAKISYQPGRLALNQDTLILVPLDSGSDSLFLAQQLQNELADWHRLILPIRRVSAIPADRRAIVMGSSTSQLVLEALGATGAKANKDNFAAEAYRLHIRSHVAVVAADDPAGTFYGFQSLRQLISADGDGIGLPCADIEDQPQKALRALKLYLPGRANIPFFKRFVRDFVAACKYNTLIVELNAGMRLESHPELNAGWREMVADTNYSRRNYPPGALHGREQNSCHQDTADGGFIEKAELADLAAFVRSYQIEFVPELPSFTHSYYLLTRHKELSEVPGDKWPDTYCPSNPDTYRLLFDVYDEYIDLLKPRMMHIGRDELYAPVGLCPRCGDRDIGERFGEDVLRVHSHLKAQNIRVAMWGDMLLESVRGTGLQDRQAPDGWKYKAPGGMRPEQVARYVPKDILIFNWFWNSSEGGQTEQQAENNEELLDRMGYEQVFGNLDSSITNYAVRRRRESLLGGAPSAWFAVNEFNFGKIMIPDFLASSNMLWEGDVIAGRPLQRLVQSRLPHIRSRFRGALPPSETEASITALDISGVFNTGGGTVELRCDLRAMKEERIFSGRAAFQVGMRGQNRAVAVATKGTTPTSLPTSVEGITIGRDASSLLFLHACALAADNREPDRLLWDVFDSADVLGWYEIVFADGFTETIPIRYGVNIAEWDWPSRSSGKNYCYEADAVTLAQDSPSPITMFAFEWENPRLGKTIVEVRLKGTVGFRGAEADYTDHYGPAIPSNAVILAAISVVEPRAVALLK